MLAQYTLTPTESKKLISKAIANIEKVQKALETGIIAIHPSSSTWFLMEELTGNKPKGDVWVCGIVVRGGTCTEIGSMLSANSKFDNLEEKPSKPSDFQHTWVLKKGKLEQGYTLRNLVDEMSEGDIYIKGVNSLDHDGNVAVLAGNPIEGGTFGFMLNGLKKKNISILYPVGFEKLIPISVFEASKIAKRQSCVYAMGISCNLIATDYGDSVAETEAFNMLAGVNAYPIASGGLEGAEGSITFVVEGRENEVEIATKEAELVKGATLPKTRVPNCSNCRAYERKMCLHPIGKKQWPHI